MWFVLASCAAICFGFRGILYQWTSQRPVDRNILLLGVYLSGTIIAFTINLYIGQPWSYGVLAGIPMGLFSFIANAAMYKGFAVGKASVIAMFTGFPPVVVAVLAYFLWGESLGMMQMIGFIMVIVALLIIRYDRDFSLELQGLKWGLLTMFFFGLTDVSSKQATLLDAATLPALTIMYGTGSLLFASLYLWPKKNVFQVKVPKSMEAGPTPWTKKRTFAWGLFVGISNIAGMILLLSAFRLGTTGIVSAISAMNVVFVLLYARIHLKESMSQRVVLGLLLALAGIIAIRLAA